MACSRRVHNPHASRLISCLNVRFSMIRGARPWRRPLPKWITPWSRKSSKFQTSKKDAFSSKMDPLWEPTGKPKSAKSDKNASPERPLDPFQKMCQNMSLIGASKPFKIKLPPRRELNSHFVALPPKSLQNGLPKPPFGGAPGP